MRKTLTVDGINISITVQDLPDTPHLKQYSSRKYDIWCQDENWDVCGNGIQEVSVMRDN